MGTTKSQNSLRIHSSLPEDSASSIWAAAWKNQQNDMYKMTCAPSEDSDQPGHLPVWSEFLLCTQCIAIKGPKVLSCGQADAQADLSLRWADAQADLSLRWAHISFCWFCHAASPILCEQTAKAQVRLSICAVSPKPQLFACVISNLFSWASSFTFFHLGFTASQDYFTYFRPNQSEGRTKMGDP